MRKIARRIWVVERSDENDCNMTYSDFYPIASENTKKEALESMKSLKRMDGGWDKYRVVPYYPLKCG
jgi:hypothetical protein